MATLPIALIQTCTPARPAAALAHVEPLIRQAAASGARTLQRCAAEGIDGRVDAVRALAAHLPFADGSVDAAVMGGSLNEIGDEAAALAEMVRVLRPGGRLFCMSLVPADAGPARLAQLLAAPNGIRFPTAARTVAWLGSSMRLVEERCDGIVLRITAEKLADRPSSGPGPDAG